MVRWLIKFDPQKILKISFKRTSSNFAWLPGKFLCDVTTFLITHVFCSIILVFPSLHYYIGHFWDVLSSDNRYVAWRGFYPYSDHRPLTLWASILPPEMYGVSQAHTFSSWPGAYVQGPLTNA